jgi:hypothetical protein
MSQPLAAAVYRWMPPAAVASLAAGVTVSLTSSVPHRLPGVALYSISLFYLERGIVALAALVVGFGLLARALLGELPVGFSASGVTYAETVRSTAHTSDVVVELSQRVDAIQNDARRLDVETAELAAAMRTVIAAAPSSTGSHGRYRSDG